MKSKRPAARPERWGASLRARRACHQRRANFPWRRLPDLLPIKTLLKSPVATSESGVKLLAITLASFAALASLRAASPASPDPDWQVVPGILARIIPPAFPARNFDITRYGAVADGRTDCTAALAAAIHACVAAGGGQWSFPAGEFLTGPIRLQSNVDLHLAATNSVLNFSTDFERLSARRAHPV